MMSNFLPGADDVSDYIFKRYEEYRDKCEALEQENVRLRTEQSGSSGMKDCQTKLLMAAVGKVLYSSDEMQADTIDYAKGESPMTDFQYKQTLEMVYQILKANFELGRQPDEILNIIAALKGNH